MTAKTETKTKAESATAPKKKRTPRKLKKKMGAAGGSAG